MKPIVNILWISIIFTLSIVGHSAKLSKSNVKITMCKKLISINSIEFFMQVSGIYFVTCLSVVPDARVRPVATAQRL